MARKILVIEDDPSSALLIAYTLERKGYQVVTAANGLEGLSKAQEEEPDLVVLDVMLPGLDGLEVCHRLKTDPRTSRLPILMVSAKAEEADKLVGEKVGADQYLAKPADPSEVLASVENLLAGGNAGPVRARTIAFLGSKGGVGTSTVAANVAVAITQANKGVLMVDLAPYCGSVSRLLSLKPEHTIAELLGASVGTLDRRQVEEVLVAHSTGVRTLCSPQTAEEYKEISPLGMVALLEVLRTMGDYVLADVPAHPSEADRAAMDEFDFIVVVTGSGRDGLASAGATTALLEKLGVAQERLGTVAVDRDGLLSEMDFSKIAPIVDSTIGVPLLAIVAHDIKASREFEAQGVPAVLAEPNRPMAASLRQVADWLMSHDTQGEGGTDG